MTEWAEPYGVSFEYWELDWATWSEVAPIAGVSECRISRDSSDDTLETAQLTCERPMGEKWFRVYLVAEQGGVSERHALGTFVAKTCIKRFGGSRGTYYEVDAYSALKPLQVSQVEPGHWADLAAGCLRVAAEICRQHGPAPVAWRDEGPSMPGYAADPDDLSALTLVRSVLERAGYGLAVDAYGRIMAEPARNPSALARVWTFEDSPGKTVVYPELGDSDDLCDVPNCMRVVYEGDGSPLVGYAENRDPQSAVSTAVRGYRQFGDPSGAVLPDGCNQSDADAEASRLLREQSRRAHTVTVSHGYCGLRLGDGVGFEHAAAGIEHVTAQVTKTTVECTTEARCETSAVYSEYLWEEGGL